MFAINHAAAALLFRNKTKGYIPFFWILVGVQLVELMWVVLNLAGIEQTSTNDAVHSVADIHLYYMPFSHSLLTSLLVAAGAFLICVLIRKTRPIAPWVALAFFSHFILDFVTHGPDLPLTFANQVKIGLGLYTNWTVLAFLVELGFGLFCWRVYRGSRTLFWIILVFNLMNITLFLPGVTGLEGLMTHKPMLIVSVILVQILVTLLLVGMYTRKKSPQLSIAG